jgi:hypothetical protein
MKLNLIKSNLRTENNGQCGSRNNARYKGSTTLWVIKDEEGLTYFESKKKATAVSVLEYATTSWDGKGDLEMAFLQALKNN